MEGLRYPLAILLLLASITWGTAFLVIAALGLYDNSYWTWPERHMPAVHIVLLVGYGGMMLLDKMAQILVPKNTTEQK